MREIKFRAWDFNNYMHSWEDLQKIPHTALWTAEDIILQSLKNQVAFPCTDLS